jgi:hypothetical protein
VASSAEFKFLQTPVEFSVDDIESAHLESFVVTGIVNPMGPTLTFLATAGKAPERPLVYAMLNPFRCEVKQIGTFTNGETWFPDEAFAALFQYLSGSCPTLVLMSKSLDAETRFRVTENLFTHFDDAEDTIENVRDFFGDPMNRVSNSMGADVPAPGPRPPEIKHAEWSEIVSDTRHIWPELTAFMVAWDGSINKTLISDQMKYGALQTERMKSILFSMLGSVWMPDPIKEEPVALKGEPQRPLPAPQSLDEVRQSLLNYSTWATLRGDNLLQFMARCLLLYGHEVDGTLVPHLSALYAQVRDHVDPEHRKLELQKISLAAEKYNLAACTLLPPLLCDDDPWVVSTAMLDYIALCHPDTSGLPFELSELDTFFTKGTFESSGGAIGGLITCGDRRFHSKLHEWKLHLTKDDIRAATNCRTPFITHGEIEFWLNWADELVNQRDPLSESIFGLLASAVGLLGGSNPYDLIKDVERRFPAYGVEDTVVVIQSWDRATYANDIADRLYRLEATEDAPKVFSAVLRAWGLQPRADLMDQFIPEDGSN